MGFRSNLFLYSRSHFSGPLIAFEGVILTADDLLRKMYKSKTAIKQSTFSKNPATTEKGSRSSTGCEAFGAVAS